MDEVAAVPGFERAPVRPKRIKAERAITAPEEL
jgi:hypothetical protein